MKKTLLPAIVLLLLTITSSAQVLPSFQFGIKGGMNLSKFTTSGTFDSGNRAGYLAGFWARIGALGINAQPEIYYASKTATIQNTAGSSTITLNSIDVPVLVGFKFGALGLGGRLATGPMASFIINKEQSFGQSTSSISSFNFKNQNYAWQFGAGVDIFKVSVDLRYELGMSNLNNSGLDQKLNLFNLSLAYKLF